MAARTIVTSHPDVACDVCGRRLLRGEQPDTFLGGGQRRLVCELCTSRATHEGWRRETEERAGAPRAERPQRGRSLLGRLRQLREPARRAPAEHRPVGVDVDGQPAGGNDPPVEAEWTSIDAEWAGVEEQWSAPTGSWDGAEPAVDTALGFAARAAVDPAVDRLGEDRADAGVERALEVFNAGEHPRRLAGVARALGAPTVRATRLESANVAVVVAWELCWYRYEIDLADEAQGAWLAAEGMELAELPGEDRVANAVADERGELSLVG
jgi:hypothetical protein